MFASISLTTFNRKKLTAFCIKTIHERTPKEKYELIVVDNGSSDGTVRMLKQLRAKKIINKLVLKHPNSLGLAINDAWEKASPKADWLIVLSNDMFCMESWFENLELIIKSNLKPDYLFACLRMPGFCNMIPHKTKNGGCFTVKKGKWKLSYPFGGGLVVKKALVIKHKVQFETIPFTFRRKSIYAAVCGRLHRMRLRFVALGKPCILMHDCEFANPEYRSYYERRFGINKKEADSDYERRMRKFALLKERGYTTNPDAYYEGSDYVIGPHYRNALKMLRK